VKAANRFSSIVSLILLLAVTASSPLNARQIEVSSGRTTARPNIVLYLSDDHGVDFVGCYGNSAVRTPNIDRLAQEGMKFNRVFAASPTCSPSRAVMFTGLWPQRNGTMGNHTDCRAGIKTLPDYLLPLGYRVVAVNKTDIRPRSAFGWEWLPATLPTDPKFRRYRDEGLDTRKVDQFLAEHVRLLLGDNGPHVVWETNRIYEPAALPMTPLLVDTPKTRLALANYCQDITTVDGRVGEVLASLKQYGVATNMLFIYTTDQGAEWPRCKWTLYDSGLRVPFIARWPGVLKPGSESGALISLVDLTPTFVALAGGKPPAGIDGLSFREVLLGLESAFRQELFASHSGDGTMNLFPQRGLREERYNYMLNLHPERDWTTHFTKVAGIPNSHAEVWNTWLERAKTDPAAAHLVKLMVHHPAEELYDTEADPYELTNLVDRVELKPVLERMRKRLAQWRQQVDDQDE